MVWPKKTKPRKKGITPSKNINKLFHDLDRVEVMRFKLFEYSRYLRMVIQANMTPKPMKTYLCLKMTNSVTIKPSRRATKAPKSWKKLPVTMTMNQKSKNFILSKKPSYYQLLFQSTWALILDY